MAAPRLFEFTLSCPKNCPHCHNQPRSPGHPQYRSREEPTRNVADVQNDFDAIRRLSAALNGLEIADYTPPRPATTNNFRRQYAKSNAEAGALLPPLSPFNRPNSAPVVHPGHSCPYVHPLSNRQCGFWFKENLSQEFYIHWAQHYVDEIRTRAQSTLAILDALNARNPQIFQQQGRQVRLCCYSCGEIIVYQMNGAQISDLYGMMCNDCSSLARRRA